MSIPATTEPPGQPNVSRGWLRRLCEVLVLAMCLAFLCLVLRFGVQDSNTYALEPAGVAVTEDGCVYLVWWANPGHTRKHVTHVDSCNNKQHPTRDTEWVLSHSEYTSREELMKEQR